MRYFNNPDVATRLCELEFKAREKVIALIPQIEKVVKQFDGKVVNKRFNDALYVIDSNLHYGTPYETFEIGMYVDERYTNDESGSSVVYINSYEMNVVRCIPLHGQNVAILEKRLVADVVIAGLKKRAKYLQNDIETIREQLQKVDEYRSRVEQIERDAAALNDEMHHCISQYFRLRVEVRA